jgi:hypothetical protein
MFFFVIGSNAAQRRPYPRTRGNPRTRCRKFVDMVFFVTASNAACPRLYEISISST